MVKMENFIHQSVFAVLEEKWVTTHNPFYVLRAVNHATRNNLPMPAWAQTPIMQAISKSYRKNGELSFEKALGITRKDYDKLEREIIVGAMVREGKQAGMKHQDAIELAKLDAKFYYGFTNKAGDYLETTTIQKYAERQKNTFEDGYGLVFNSALYQHYRREFNIFVMAAQDPVLRGKCLYARLEAYHQAFEERLDEKNPKAFVKFLNKATAKAIEAIEIPNYLRASFTGMPNVVTVE